MLQKSPCGVFDPWLQSELSDWDRRVLPAAAPSLEKSAEGQENSRSEIPHQKT